MTRNAVCTGMLALFLAPLFVGPVHAADPEGNVWLWIRPGWMRASLDAANDVIDDGNARFESLEFATLDPFHNTFYIGAEVHANVASWLTAYAGYGSSFGSESKSFNRVIKMQISGNPISGGVLYRVPWPAAWEDAVSDLDLFVGGGPVFMSGFEFTASDEDRTTAREFLEERIFSGDGLGFELRMNMEFYLSPKFTLTGGAMFRSLSLSDLQPSVNVNNPNAFNPDGDKDGDGVRNSRDPDYDGDATGRGGNTQRLYGAFVADPENPGEVIWQKPRDRFLESLYIYDENAYDGAPSSFQVYDPAAVFDLGLSGVQIQIGLSYYIF